MADAEYRDAVSNLTEGEARLVRDKANAYVGRLRELETDRAKNRAAQKGKGGSGTKRQRKAGAGRMRRRGRLG